MICKDNPCGIELIIAPPFIFGHVVEFRFIVLSHWILAENNIPSLFPTCGLTS